MPVLARRRRKEAPVILSTTEAAFVTQLPRKTVDQAIDRKEVLPVPAPAAEPGQRALGYPELVYLRARSEVGKTLSAAGKRELYRELRRAEWPEPEPSVRLGMVSITLEQIVAEILERIELVEAAREFVTEDPDVRAGEPVVRGTRVPVYMLADLVRQGATPEELAEDYPAVSPEALEAALLFARLHPRRGPRRRAPWHYGDVARSSERGE